MTKLSPLLLYILVLFCCSDCNKATAKAPIKIACVGNSITYGAGMANRIKNAYPTQLQALLGGGYEVGNFGVNGTTLLKKGDYPYWNTEAYENALNFHADILFIMLGTNDSKLQNRVYLDEFEEDYHSLIASFRKQQQPIRIILLLPVPSFLQDTTSIWNPVIKNEIIPLTQKVAYASNSEVIDLYQLFVNKPELLPDYIHPSSLGATIIAKRTYEAVLQNTDNNFDLIKNLKLKEIRKSSFYGFKQIDFQFKDIPCKIVRPKKSLPDKPWVWRARFWGHEPQTDIALLERGFHLVYCDVSDLFGSPEAVKRWNRFYDFMKMGGLSEKVVLEGMSRGGLIIYNWAAENPQKVACIYADAPVLDGTSWPGGFAKSEGSQSDWQRFQQVYNLDPNASVSAFSDNPIHKVNKITDAGIPVMHVCGELDKVVPVSENTRAFERKVNEVGGEIIVIYKKGVGHHPHSLENPTPIVNFILRATRYKINFAGIIAPGSEYRSGAGWKEGKGWWAQMQDIDSLCRNSGNIDLLLIGNSITQGWGGNRSLTTYKPGQQAADAYFNDLSWISAGISGDRTQHIAWRLKNGHYDKCKPDFVTLAIGVNNFSENTPEEIALGIEKDIKLMEEKFPNSIILFFGPLPAGLTKDAKLRKIYTQVHRMISHFGNKKNIQYSNLIGLFSNKDGALDPDYYSNDSIHLKPKGYEVWARYIKDQIEKLK